MLGWRSAKDAKALGFTHHGSYYGLPIYLGFEGEPSVDTAPLVAVKWAPLELVFDLFVALEDFFRPMMFPDDEPGFQFQVGDKL